LKFGRRGNQTISTKARSFQKLGWDPCGTLVESNELKDQEQITRDFGAEKQLENYGK